MHGPMNVKFTINAFDLRFYSEQFTVLVPTDF